MEARLLPAAISDERMLAFKHKPANPHMEKYTVVVEKGESGYYIAYVPSIPGCHTQAKTIPKLMERVKEAIELCLESGMVPQEKTSFVGVRTVALTSSASTQTA